MTTTNTRRCIALTLAAICIACRTKEDRHLISTTGYDYHGGAVAMGTELAHEFALLNPSDFEVKIVRITASCGCIESRIEPEVIPPGGTAQLKAKIHLTGTVGRRERITVLSEASNGERDILDFGLAANIRQDMRLTSEPTALQLVSSLDGMELSAERIRVSFYHYDAPIAGVDVATPTWLTAHVKELEASKLHNGMDEQIFMLSASLANIEEAKAAGGGTITVTPKQQSNVAAVAIPVLLVDKSDFAIAPSGVYFGAVGEDGATAQVTLTRVNGSEAIVDDFEVSDAAVSASLMEVGGGYNVSLSMLGGGPRGPFAGHISLTLKGGYQSKETITFGGTRK